MALPLRSQAARAVQDRNSETVRDFTDGAKMSQPIDVKELSRVLNGRSVQEAVENAQRYEFWRDHPRSYFVIVVNSIGETSLKMEVCPVQGWDQAFTADKVTAAIDAAIANTGTPCKP